MKALIFGLGSIGERHLYNLKKLNFNDIGIYDVDHKKALQISKKYKTKYFLNIDDALSFDPTFSLVCTPSNSHLEIMKKCLKADSHVFVEKPISHSLEGVKQILSYAQKNNLKISVGHNLRFEKGLSFMKKKLNNLEIGRPLSIFAQWGNNIKNWNHPNFLNHYILKKGGGIILDDSHEYDYLRWILNDEVSSVYCQTQKLTSIKTQTESLASIILKFKKGTIATLILDYVRPKYERNCHIIGEKGDLRWEFSRESSKKPYQVKSSSKVSKTNLGKLKKQTQSFHQNLNSTYIAEIQNLIDCIKFDKEPLSNGFDGYRTLQIGAAALKSAKLNKIIKI